MVNDVLNDSESIINKIIDQTDLTKDELTKQINEKIEEYGGLLTEAGAAYSIAKEKGIEKAEPDAIGEGEKTKIKELEDGESNINLEARVKRIYATNTFQRDEGEGNVTNMEIKDDTGETIAVLWNKKPLLDKMARNTPIRISNGYVKSRNDELRVNVGSYGTVEVLKESDLPEVNEKQVALNQVKPGMEDINTYVRIERVFPMNTFQKEDREGKVTNTIATDGKERTRVVMWGNHAEEAQNLEKNDLIKIEGGYTKDNDGRTEIHLGWKSRLIKNPETEKHIPEVKVNRETIKSLKEKPEGQEATIKATIVQLYEPTLIKICPECGEMIQSQECGKHGDIDDPKHVPILNAILDDGQDTVRCTFYREKAEKILGVTGEELEKEEKQFQEIKKEILGDEKLFTGRMKHNTDFDRYEFTIISMNNVNIDKEIDRIKGEIND